MKNFVRCGWLALALCGLAACAGTGGNAPAQGSNNSAGATRSNGGVEVFGTIDAGVTHTTTKSGR